MKRNLITQIPCALLLILSVAVPGCAQDGKGANQTLQSVTQKVITDPAEYAAYIAAINTTTSLESRQAALDAFLQRFPNSAMRDELEDSLFETIVRLDNERTARVRAELRYKRIQGAAFARNLASRHDLNYYAPCRLGQFEMHEAPEDDRPFYSTVSTSRGERKIEVMHRINFYIAYGGIPFVNFKAEKLGSNYARDKEALIDGLRMLGDEPDTDLAGSWPSMIGSFEVYGINRQHLSGMVLGAYLLFRDADMTVITLYLMNSSPETTRFHTIKEYRALRDDFLMGYTTCSQ
ncbi:MAG TPA: hypothetical protein VH024_10790 [Candidatus Angelobacter sp.]|nr:hypothetical protein [Candidatus Angelobacter sp.]